MRNAMDIATLGTSVNVRLSADKKTVERARVAFGVAGPVPLRAAAAEGKHRPVFRTFSGAKPRFFRFR